MCRLHLNENKIQSVPPELGQLLTPSLREVEMSHNPFVELPSEVIARMRAVEGNSSYLNTSLPDEITQGNTEAEGLFSKKELRIVHWLFGEFNFLGGT